MHFPVARHLYCDTSNLKRLTATVRVGCLQHNGYWSVLGAIEGGPLHRDTSLPKENLAPHEYSIDIAVVMTKHATRLTRYIRTNAYSLPLTTASGEPFCDRDKRQELIIRLTSLPLLLLLARLPEPLYLPRGPYTSPLLLLFRGIVAQSVTHTTLF